MRNTTFLNRLHVWNSVRIIEVSDNRGTDNRGRTGHIFVRNSGWVGRDRKPILHAYITRARAGDMGHNQHGFVTADWLKP